MFTLTSVLQTTIQSLLKRELNINSIDKTDIPLSSVQVVEMMKALGIISTEVLLANGETYTVTLSSGGNALSAKIKKE
jgi:hypothetical protein